MQLGRIAGMIALSKELGTELNDNLKEGKAKEDLQKSWNKL